MGDALRLYCKAKHGASQVVSLRDRISAHRVNRVHLCELNGLLTLRVFWRSPTKITGKASP